MSTMIAKQSNVKYVTEGYIDTRAEMLQLSTEDYHPGSQFLVVEDGSVWVLNQDRQWKEIQLGQGGNGGNSGSGSGGTGGGQNGNGSCCCDLTDLEVLQLLQETGIAIPLLIEDNFISVEETEDKVIIYIL